MRRRDSDVCLNGVLAEDRYLRLVLPAELASEPVRPKPADRVLLRGLAR